MFILAGVSACVRQYLKIDEAMGKMRRADIAKSEHWTAELARLYVEHYNRGPLGRRGQFSCLPFGSV